MKLLYTVSLLGFLSAYSFGQNSLESLQRRAASLPPGREKMLTLDKLREIITLSRKNLDQAFWIVIEMLLEAPG